MTSKEQETGPSASLVVGTPTRTILSDEPKFSSAALCLTLHHGTSTFRPEFTHQCVENETFRGYKPVQSALVEAKEEFKTSLNNGMSIKNENSILHESHLNHDKAENELDVQIVVAPSCRQCQIDVHIQRLKREMSDISDEVNNQQSKKQRIDGTSVKSVTWNLTSINNEGTDTSSSPSLSELEIKEAIQNALPQISNNDCKQDYLSQPIGKILSEYSVSDKNFVLCLAKGDSNDVLKYHDQVQKLALWFIENADDINVSDTQSGFWKVLYLFQKQVSGYSLVGYITLFHFNSPFHKPEPGIIVRVCQALVLPSYQRQGHGKRMMQCVYDIMHGKYEGAYSDVNQKVVQINVEDPAPGFVALRNKIDINFLTENKEWLPTSKASIAITDEKYFTALTDTEAVETAAIAKITPRQVQIVYEVMKLRSLNSCSDDESDKEELEKRFRLMVKRRLNKEHREEMTSYPTKDEKKAYLAKLFDEEFELYQKLLVGKSNT